MCASALRDAANGREPDEVVELAAGRVMKFVGMAVSVGTQETVAMLSFAGVSVCYGDRELTDESNCKMFGK